MIRIHQSSKTRTETTVVVVRVPLIGVVRVALPITVSREVSK